MSQKTAHFCFNVTLNCLFIHGADHREEFCVKETSDWFDLYIRESAMNSNLLLLECENEDFSQPRKYLRRKHR